MFLPRTSVVVNENTHQGLRLVYGAGYKVLDVMLDKAYPNNRINADTVLHFGRPARILQAADSPRDFRFVGKPPNATFLVTTRTRVECQKKRLWKQANMTHKELPCVIKFACTEYKVQQTARSGGAGAARDAGDEHQHLAVPT
jgi:hypothetical protein